MGAYPISKLKLQSYLPKIKRAILVIRMDLRGNLFGIKKEGVLFSKIYNSNLLNGKLLKAFSNGRIYKQKLSGI